MSQIKLYFVAFCFLGCLSLYSQKSDNENIDKAQIEIDGLITQSGFDVERGEYLKAQNNLKQALEVAETAGNQKYQGILHTKIAKLQYTLNDDKNALMHLSKAAEHQRQINDYSNLAITYHIRGVVHAGLGDYQTALDYFNSSKTQFEENELEEFIPEVLLNEAKVQIELKNYNKAKSLLEQAIVMARKYDENNVLSSALIQNGMVLNELNNYDTALQKTQEGLAISIKGNQVDNVNKAYLILSDIYNNKGNFKNSNDYLRKHIQLSDSLYEVNKDHFTNMQLQGIGNSFNEVDYQKLKTQIDEQKAESNLTRITTILSIALITILSLLTLSLYKNNNIRLKTNNMLHKKNDELIVAKEKAELASKTKANFLSTVTHELRTPLYAVTGLTNMLLEENPKPDQIPHLKSLKFSGDYLLTFINDILQINKIEANKVELDPELFNLKKKVENVIAALNNSALDNNVKIHFEFDKELPQTFVGDNLKISQILINLIGNAIKFTKDGDIWVRLKKVKSDKDDYVIRFEVEDNGIGISKDKQEHMFESFSQGSIQINRKYGGTGLGLSIVKGLIDILKGTIYLKSELGKGSTFTFEIPLTYSSESKPVKKEDYSKNINQLDLTNIKILVVEDNKINQMITKKILNKMNLHCDVVDNGEEAVEKVRNNSYSVVLMDIHMPGISGLEATKIIRSFDKELTIFALTAVTLEDKMHEFDEAGFNDIISKPFKQEDFEKKLYLALANNQNSATPIE
ncbi:ATP-binding protein [Aegicerativicinus sediminis]|uniref:ATP-binding protein n=1 Tax=Aegicerativicinus sediminis TaxID=2893202 RepID=UPI001E2A8693|nr:ATP-binding protein [Aegicerativicinus sediminis]